MKTFLLSVAAVFLVYLIGSWYWVAGSTTTEEPIYRTLAVTRDDLLIAVAATGTIEPVEVVDVGAQIVGRIQSFGEGIDYRSDVKQGMVIAKIDDSPYQAEVASAKADMQLAQAELSRAEAAMAQADREFKRAERLRNTSPEAEYERALSAIETSRADVEVAKARIEQARVALETAEINLGYTIIKSPIDGVIIDRRVNVGQTVVAGLNAPSLFLIAKDLDQMQVWAAVNEADIGQVHVGQKVTFRVDAYRDRVFTGSVSQIRLNASMTHNVVTYGVIVDVDNPDGKLLPYMTANLQFEVARVNDALLVPNQALRWAPSIEQVLPEEREEIKSLIQAGADGSRALELSSPVVWIRAGTDFVRPVLVKTGLSDGNVTEIVEGDLQPGDEVVITRVQKPTGDFASTFLSRITGPKVKKDGEAAETPAQE